MTPVKKLSSIVIDSYLVFLDVCVMIVTSIDNYTQSTSSPVSRRKVDVLLKSFLLDTVRQRVSPSKL